jgi:signal transduction histidine kinase
MTAPLRRLTAAAEAVAQGDLSQRVPPGPDDEIGSLGNAFNRMAGSLEQAEDLRRHMVADIAHELRTPLSVIQAQVEAIQDGVFPADAEHIQPIHEETLLLKRLVDDLRTLALADAGQLALTPMPVDLDELARRAVSRFEPQATEKGVVLTADSSPALPTANLDPQRMDQVLGILLDNALRHTPPGGRIRLSVGPSPLTPGPPLLSPKFGRGERGQGEWGEGGWLRLSVADSGPGIPPDDLPHVFDRFWRGEKSRSRAGGGSGLGLAIAKQLVEAHGGRIHAESAAGQGATFVIDVPVTIVHAQHLT